MNNKIECFLAVMEGDCYLIPSELRDNFDGTSFYDRRKEFSNYIIPDGAIIEEILVNDHDLEELIAGDFY